MMETMPTHASVHAISLRGRIAAVRAEPLQAALGV